MFFLSFHFKFSMFISYNHNISNGVNRKWMDRLQVGIGEHIRVHFAIIKYILFISIWMVRPLNICILSQLWHHCSSQIILYTRRIKKKQRIENGQMEWDNSNNIEIFFTDFTSLDCPFYFMYIVVLNQTKLIHLITQQDWNNPGPSWIVWNIWCAQILI